LCAGLLELKHSFAGRSRLGVDASP
jgi:hypothetical protein